MKLSMRKFSMETIAVLLSLLILVPIYMILVNSFKDYASSNKLSLSWNGVTVHQIMNNYSEVIQIAKLATAYKNSLLITCVSVILIVFFGAMSGFIIQRRKSRLTEGINYAIIAGLSVPFCAPATFFLIKSLGLSQTYTGIILVFVALSFPTSVFLFTGYFKSIPIHLDESAALDGCGPIRLFGQIILPLILPVTVTVIIISFMGIWNDFSVSIFLMNTPKKFTVVLTTFSFYGQKHSDWNLLFANIILISLPIVVIFLVLQKYVVSGLTSGAVKG
ncbi:carbohydrate ABC transporter permease [Paenibacillus sp. Soil750]|uniref:carbohydrate ABC transporter permease n=1 Tax=Paenibacillus sp. Soil750 TaxID=1736398 RepID=UPI0006FE0B2E|nr:carbohydrate ABC transporter permease [Paenibacillus sp. Soil750]KRE69760.1 hypothetical protein ASL11_15455 [Paenibacillus sp. Soil750]